MPRPLVRLWNFYRDGFRGMRLGRTLWRVVLIKLAVLLLLAKVLLPDPLHDNFTTDRARADQVLEHLTRRAAVR